MFWYPHVGSLMYYAWAHDHMLDHESDTPASFLGDREQLPRHISIVSKVKSRF